MGKGSGTISNPCGAVNETVVGAPKSPGLVQKTCQPGSSSSSTPIVNDRPARILVTSATSDARTCPGIGGGNGLAGGAAAVGAGAASSNDPLHNSKSKTASV